MWKVVVQNLLYFMHDLLPAAFTHGCWTKDGVDRAVSWSLYCEKAVKQLSENASMHVAFKGLVEKYNWVLSFQQLQSAQLHLFRFLFQNQLIDEEVKSHINQKALEILGAEITEDLCKEVAQQADCHKKLMEHLYKTDKKVHLKFQMLFLLEAANSFKFEQMHAQFKKVVMSPCGLESLVEAMLAQRNDKNISKASLVVIKWLESVLQLQEGSAIYISVITQLSTLSPGVLCNLLSTNQLLHSVLLLSLKREAMKLCPCYENGHCTWDSTDNNTCPLKYKDFVNICSSLMADDCIGLVTKQKVSSWCLEDGGMVWSDVLSELNRIDNCEHMTVNQ